MICQTCHGDPRFRVTYLPWTGGEVWSLSCPECGGCGITHCCEGLREQPEAEKGFLDIRFKNVSKPVQ